MKNIMVFVGGALAVLGIGIWLAIFANREGRVRTDAASPVDAILPIASNKESPVRTGAIGTIASTGRGGDTASAEADESAGDEDQEPAKTPEELKAEKEEALVDSFDNLTDKWMEPAAKGVTMADIDAFVEQFKKVPKDRQEECLQRALNLVPDENVMLLAGILMDKSQPKELVELVFNDILNRDEDVKKPILQQIFKDKSHPCWAETAWIFDVTGETSAKTTSTR